MIQNSSFTPIRRIKRNPFDSTNKDDYDINLRTSLNSNKKNNPNLNVVSIEKFQSNPSMSLQKTNKNAFQLVKTSISPSDLKKDLIKLPTLTRRSTLNPQKIPQSPQKNKKLSSIEQKTLKSPIVSLYYQKKLERSLIKHQTTYMMNLFRQHFYQCIEILRFGKEFKVFAPKKPLNLSKANPDFKTIFLDLDQTLIHCDQKSDNYTIKLNFPLQRGGNIAAGVRIRSFCKQFLQELSKIAEIIIFTASSASYADVILDHIDPKRQLIAHRMYRHNCTLQKGFYLKDLRMSGRPLQSSALVDNSAYCHIIQPENAIPIVPFFHYPKDRQLQSLLDYLKILIQQKDMRIMLKQTFFYGKYFEDSRDPRKVFLNNVQKMQENIKNIFDLSSSTG